jgi:flagellar biosynthesis/type III secretory pathway chaperone
METAWESELASLLTNLLAVQDELIAILVKKRQMLIDADTVGLAAIGQQEQNLISRLQQCVQQREGLLKRTAAEGLPSGSIRSLTATLPKDERGDLGKRVKVAVARGRLLQHHSLTNWVLVQRSLLHLSQLLEIIATGGQAQPTYEKDSVPRAGGVLVDQEA